MTEGRVNDLINETLYEVKAKRERVSYIFNKLTELINNGKISYKFFIEVIEDIKRNYAINRPLNIYAPSEIRDLETKVSSDVIKLYEELYNIFVKQTPAYISWCNDAEIKQELYNLCDSEKKEFKGDIIITDPCYIIRSEWHIVEVKEPRIEDYVKPMDNYADVVIVDKNELIEQLGTPYYEAIDAKLCKYSYRREEDKKRYNFDLINYKHREREMGKCTDDWTDTDCGRNVEHLGIKQYMARNTIEGDWTCTVFDMYSKALIGNFNSDAGMVCVAEIGEFKKYNPNIVKWLKGQRDKAVVIENFDGKVWFEIDDSSFVDIQDLFSNLEYIKNYTLHIVGEGTKNGKPFKFKSMPLI